MRDAHERVLGKNDELGGPLGRSVVATTHAPTPEGVGHSAVGNPDDPPSPMGNERVVAAVSNPTISPDSWSEILGSTSLLETRTRVHPVRAGAARNDTTAIGLRPAGGGYGRSRGDTARLAAPTTSYVRLRRQGADPAPSPARPRCCETTGVRGPGPKHREVSTPEAAAKCRPYESDAWSPLEVRGDPGDLTPAAAQSHRGPGIAATACPAKVPHTGPSTYARKGLPLRAG